ncbi:MAG: YfhO family protein [Chitinophagaceae bacterium]|nr:YfhO family protein [Chitinophagaceae bacterium]
MNKSVWQRIQPHAIAIAVFVLISIIYCIPAIQGLVVNQSDVIGWKGMAQQSIEFKEKYGYFPLWTNSLFGGMPAYQVYIEAKYNISPAILDGLFRLFLPGPAGLFFMNCLGFYILARVLGLRTWVAIFGSLAYAFCSYSPILVATGHTTKLASMGYAPALIAGFILLTQRKYVWGLVTMVLFATLLFYQNHIQILYYTLLILACASVAFVIKAIREKQFRHLAMTAGLGIVAGIISAASYAVMLMPLNEYAKETMRGGRSELTLNKPKEDKTKGGLDKEYAFRWSYGIGESQTFMVPAARGGGSSANELGEQSKAIEAMQDAQLPENAIQYFRQYMSPYWGGQPNTSGPVYFGIVVLFLTIVALVLYRGAHLGWLIAASIIGILMAWGNNFSAFNYFLFDYLPMYNKFRAPSMSLVIPQLTLAVLASIGLQELVYREWNTELLRKKMKTVFIVTGIMAAIMLIGYFMADFKGTNDTGIKSMIAESLTRGYSQGQQPTEQIAQKANADSGAFMSGLAADRQRLYTADLIRSLIFLALGVALAFFAARKKLAPLYVVIGFTILSFIDLIGVDLRYLSKKDYVDEDEMIGTAFTPNAADQQILQDTGYYRVFDQTENFTNESRSAYHHNSIGGYHPAKLALYQDLIENQISKNNLEVLNMLNTKYFIVANQQTQQPMALPNPGALGPVWFVKAIKYVNNADEEMTAMNQFIPADTVIIDKREQSKITAVPVPDSTASIRLLQNMNDYILYESRAASNQLAVFSEIYYPYGWKAFVDSKEVQIARVNYALRGLPVPAGNHKIEFRFDPQTKKTGDTISFIISILSWIIIVGGIIWELRRSLKTVAPKTANK